MSLVVSHDDTYGCMDWDSNTVVTANGLQVYMKIIASTYDFMRYYALHVSN